jgi:DNA-binding transcriptional ArsR family regulator
MYSNNGHRKAFSWKEIMMKSTLVELAQRYAMFSDRTRLHILQILARGPRNVTSLCKELKLKQPIVSSHLGLLRMSGFVEGKRKSREVIYETNKAALKALAAAIATLTPR